MGTGEHWWVLVSTGGHWWASHDELLEIHTYIRTYIHTYVFTTVFGWLVRMHVCKFADQ